MAETIQRDGALLRVLINPNGRATVPVTVFELSSDRILHHDEIKLGVEQARVTFADSLAPTFRPEARTLLQDLAVELALRPPMTEKSAAAGQGQAPGFPTIQPWPDEVDGAAWLAEASSFLRKFVAMDAASAWAASLWALVAHATEPPSSTAPAPFPDTSPLLALSSPMKRCGKSRLLSLIGAVVPRPLTVSNLTPAVVFRAVEKFRPSLLVDEADSFLTKSDDLRGLLNSGHTRAGAFALRCEGDTFEPRTFSTWCPKAVAGIGKLPATLEDRSIVIHLRRRAPGESVARLRVGRLQQEAETLRRQAARWAADNLPTLRESDPTLPAGLHDRAGDNWSPLLAVAEAIGGSWPERARRAALALSGAADAEEAGELLLSDIRNAFEANGDRLTSRDLLDTLKGLPERPWAEWRHGKGLSERTLAGLLKPFGVAPRVVRMGTSTPRGYALADFADAFSRYLAPNTPPQSATSATSLSDKELAPLSIRNMTPPVADAGEGVSRCQIWHVADVADRKGVPEPFSESAPTNQSVPVVPVHPGGQRAPASGARHRAAGPGLEAGIPLPSEPAGPPPADPFADDPPEELAPGDLNAGPGRSAIDAGHLASIIARGQP